MQKGYPLQSLAEVCELIGTYDYEKIYFMQASTVTVMLVSDNTKSKYKLAQ